MYVGLSRFAALYTEFPPFPNVFLQSELCDSSSGHLVAMCVGLCLGMGFGLDV